VIAFVVKGRIALALGDPIGPAEDLAAAIAAFADHCGRNDWRPAFYQTFPDTLASYQESRLDTLCIGHEGIVDLATFTLEGHDNKALRSSMNRLTRLGARAEFHEPPLDPRLMEELRDVSDDWLNTVRGSEKQFSLGWFDDDYIRSSPVMTVVGEDGAVRAFANLMPEYQLNEATCDLMRQRHDAWSGTMDFLFIELFRWARAHGHDTFNLGLCAFAGVGEQPGDPATERALHFIYEHLNQYYSFKGLYEYKSKFHPIWSPRYLDYPGVAALPAVAVALILADSGGSVLWQRRKARASLGGRAGASVLRPSTAG
jgi:phosphatidylglycerol lysyltransferase